MLRCKWIRKSLNLLLLALAIYATQRFCRKQTDSFALYKICSHLPYNPDWETPPLQEEEQKHLSAILDQPYTYLAKGAQCYVFLSDDKEYVIKFFRLYHLLPPFWVDLPLPPFLEERRSAKIAQKEEELNKDFLSYKIAFEEMRAETGLLYVHLNKTDHLHQKITIIDKLEIAHELELDQMEFLVQRRAELVFPALEKMVETQGMEAARAALTGLVDLLILRCQKGIFDKDPDLNTNFGFIGQKPLQIDIGRYRKQEKTGVDRDEIIRITDNLNQWLRTRYPSLSQDLESHIATLTPQNNDV